MKTTRCRACLAPFRLLRKPGAIHCLMGSVDPPCQIELLIPRTLALILAHNLYHVDHLVSGLDDFGEEVAPA